MVTSNFASATSFLKFYVSKTPFCRMVWVSMQTVAPLKSLISKFFKLISIIVTYSNPLSFTAKKNLSYAVVVDANFQKLKVL